MPRITTWSFAIAALVLAVEPSSACRGAQYETSTVLGDLPAAAQTEPVVARIKILEVLRPTWVTTDDWSYSPRIRVLVVEAIKGVEARQVFVVDTIGTSCDQSFPRSHPNFKAE